MTKEQDKQIAEKVMGWRHDFLVNRKDEGRDCYWILTESGFPEDEQFVMNFNPTTDANDDYRVLEHIRDKWGEGKVNEFMGKLYDIWLHKNKRGYENPPLVYEPGDYSLAALRVLSDE